MKWKKEWKLLMVFICLLSIACVSEVPVMGESLFDGTQEEMSEEDIYYAEHPVLKPMQEKSAQGYRQENADAVLWGVGAAEAGASGDAGNTCGENLTWSLTGVFKSILLNSKVWLTKS